MASLDLELALSNRAFPRQRMFLEPLARRFNFLESIDSIADAQVQRKWMRVAGVVMLAGAGIVWHLLRHGRG